jgi:alpha-galactosidase
MNRLARPVRLAAAMFATVITTIATAQDAPSVTWLADLDLAPIRQGWGQAQKDRAVTGRPLAIAGSPFARGIGTHAKARIWLALHGKALRFTAAVGVDDGATDGGRASLTFTVLGDGRKLFDSGVMRRGEPAKPVDVDVAGIQHLLLLCGDAGDGIDSDHADWADPKLTWRGTGPQLVGAPDEPAVLLTPPPPLAPRIHGPALTGCRPGHPFLHRIPTTGERPMTFTAENLPATVQLDPTNGILRGTTPAAGTYSVALRARNRHGEDHRTLRIVAGDRLALTPPMGWNHWYAHYDRITDELVRHAADTLVASGMADVGYQYVNLDDCWMNASQHRDPRRIGPLRDDRGDILPNSYFPDMAALTAYIHERGLKAGIYTSPGPTTCAGFAGSHGHEAADARRFAAWGFDFLKYDWCSYGSVLANERGTHREPYRVMGNLLQQQDRDIVFNLCQYGMGDVWTWGAEVGGHCWRTAGDLGFELDRIFEVALANARHAAWSKPGAFNDPDYLQIGAIGDARTTGEPQPCGLTPNEQYSFMSLWCLMAAPLVYSGDLRQLDPFTHNVLCNPEVIAVDQDELCHSARVVDLGEEQFAMVKDLVDGSRAVGVFHRGEFPAQVAVDWAKLGLAGPLAVRDLWRQQDLGEVGPARTFPIGRHGCVLLRVTARP